LSWIEWDNGASERHFRKPVPLASTSSHKEESLDSKEMVVGFFGDATSHLVTVLTDVQSELDLSLDSILEELDVLEFRMSLDRARDVASVGFMGIMIQGIESGLWLLSLPEYVLCDVHGVLCYAVELLAVSVEAAELSKAVDDVVAIDIGFGEAPDVNVSAGSELASVGISWEAANRKAWARRVSLAGRFRPSFFRRL
jgi:hypothetical protein